MGKNVFIDLLEKCTQQQQKQMTDETKMKIRFLKKLFYFIISWFFLHLGLSRQVVVRWPSVCVCGRRGRKFHLLTENAHERTDQQGKNK